MSHDQAIPWMPASPRVDVALAVALMLAVAAIDYWLSGWLQQTIGQNVKWTWNVWFDGDQPRMVARMTRRASEGHARTLPHPLFSLIAYPVMKVTRAISNAGPVDAMRLIFAGLAALWTGALFSVLRLIGCPRLDALIWVTLAVTSAAFLFWFSVPETFAFGSLTMLLAYFVVALDCRRPVPWHWYVATNILTLGVTVTNWMASLAATWVRFPLRRFVPVIGVSLLIALVLVGVQHWLFPTTGFSMDEDRGYFLMPEAGGPLNTLRVFLFHSMVMPELWVKLDTGSVTRGLVLSVQGASAGSASPLGLIATGLWAALLGIGAWALFRSSAHLRFRIALGLVLIGQLLLHAVYGRETFLYSLHLLPLVIILVASASLTRARAVALVLAVSVTVLSAVNNANQFAHAAQCYATLEKNRSVTPEEDAMFSQHLMGVAATSRCPKVQ